MLASLHIIQKRLCSRYGDSHQEPLMFNLPQAVFQVNPETAPQVIEGGEIYDIMKGIYNEKYSGSNQIVLDF